MKTVASLQSNYIPWKGYFDIIHDVDEFIFCDDLQYTVKDWRNRNQIFTPQGKIWLTVPVGTNEHRQILDVRIPNPKWQMKHFNTLKMAYHKAPFFSKYEEFLASVYLDRTWDYLYELDRFLIVQISRFLGIKTVFTDSRNYVRMGRKHERLLNMLVSAKTDIYVSGPSAKNYIIEEDYQKMGIKLIWKDYANYPVYPQYSKMFSHNVSILDLLFNVGDDAPYYIWGWREK